MAKAQQYVYKVLLAGKTGTGKKTRFIKGLANNVTGSSEMLPITTELEAYDFFHEGVKFTFYDSHGMNVGANTDNRGDNFSYLKEIVTKNILPDAIIFFISMDQPFSESLNEEDMYVIKNISNALGWVKLRHAMFMLCFANIVKSPN